MEESKSAIETVARVYWNDDSKQSCSFTQLKRAFLNDFSATTS